MRTDPTFAELHEALEALDKADLQPAYMLELRLQLVSEVCRQALRRLERIEKALALPETPLVVPKGQPDEYLVAGALEGSRGA